MNSEHPMNFKPNPVASLVAGLLASALSGSMLAAPVRASLREVGDGRWSIAVDSVPGAVYRIQTTATLDGEWQWSGDELVATGDSTTFAVDVADAEARRFWRVARLARRIAFLGDSITDGISGLDYTLLRGYGAVAQMAMGHRFSLVPRSNAYATDLDHGYGGFTALHLADGRDGVQPAVEVAATDADLVFVNAGINDINAGDDASTTVARIVALHRKLHALGKSTIGSTLMGFGPVYGAAKRDVADAVNANLPSALAAIGVPVLAWHTVAERDASGFVVPGDLYDGIHPSAALGVKTGLALADFLNDRVGQAPFVPPAADSPLWVTASPYVTGNVGGKDPLWVPQWGSAGNTYQKISGPDGSEWQQCTSNQGGENGLHSIYAASPFGGTTPGLAGRRIRGVARIELPPGNTLKGATLLAHCQNAAYTVLRSRYAMYCWDDEVRRSGGPLQPFAGLFLTEEFTVPADTQWIRLEILWWGEGAIRFRQAGIFEVPATS